ncbi:MAG: WYL domain-containing protein [Ruminococcaceae bacterium]|nr:WYL domain-containing protein [Oscillospiraceae bacterium]
MSSYSELIKNFEKVRAYIREFYIYGFKSRDEYKSKSLRSYDDERRRIESWLGDHMNFVRTPEGKNIFISIDSRSIGHNPFYKALKAKSFTDGDITLHFIIFDILCEPSVKRTVSEIMSEIDKEYLSGFETPMVFDESTVRKKLKEYCNEGILVREKGGRKVYYRRSESTDVSGLNEALHYFSEVAPCGAVGSFILDKEDLDNDTFTFKHHYITGAMDSGVLTSLFVAMREKRAVTVSNFGRRMDVPQRSLIIPLRVFISVQSGRQHLVAYLPEYACFQTYRLDHLSEVKLEEEDPRFDGLRAELDEMQTNMWGVSVRREDKLEHVEFTVKIDDNEDFIVNRLEREKRIGRVEKLNEHSYRFSADVYDINELIPWIRTFICRIEHLDFSDKLLENRFRADLDTMYRMYSIENEVCK